MTTKISTTIVGIVCLLFACGASREDQREVIVAGEGREGSLVEDLQPSQVSGGSGGTGNPVPGSGGVAVPSPGSGSAPGAGGLPGASRGILI